MKEYSKSKKVIEFIPSLTALAIGIVVLLVYLFALKRCDFFDIFVVFVPPAAALVIPILNRIFRINIPIALNIAITAFAVISIDGGTTLGFYDTFEPYDKIMHTLFGIWGAFGIFIFLLYCKGEKLNSFCFFLIILFGVLGVAAVWEVYEFFADAAFGLDMQNWKEGLETLENGMPVAEFIKSYRPLSDSIWDIIVAAIGCFIFFFFILIDKFCGYKFSKKIYAITQMPRTPRKKRSKNSETDEVQFDDKKGKG